MATPRILLVEDDPFAQELITSILERHDWRVDLAADGFASLRLLRDNVYQVALIDYHLPEMDGYALARLMRDDCGAHTDHLHLIGMTADRHGLAARRGVDHVFDDILAKPFQPDDLMAALAKASPADSERRDVMEAAAALLANPDFDRARSAAASIWRARGLRGFPRAQVVPAPTAEQSAAVRICFDIVEDASAEIVLILDARGLQELLRSRLSTASHLPIVTLDNALAIVADAYFSVAESASWSSVAGLVSGGEIREKPTIAGRGG
ncbi:MAG: response regulator [Rhodopseudomonas sp.]|uniref:response regulator n=1 Tax=Rhodopseudomonas sp. TaxID=1078 RepID=UPI00178ECA70|nr:response regulator [Rhodopseudomonas sp.]NVN86932.1 response regulator [Rhodopseudomonas sp.]